MSNTRNLVPHVLSIASKLHFNILLLSKFLGSLESLKTARTTDRYILVF